MQDKFPTLTRALEQAAADLVPAMQDTQQAPAAVLSEGRLAEIEARARQARGAIYDHARCFFLPLADTDTPDLIASHRAQASHIAAQAAEIERLKGEFRAVCDALGCAVELSSALDAIAGYQHSNADLCERAEARKARAADLEAQVQRRTAALERIIGWLETSRGKLSAVQIREILDYAVSALAASTAALSPSSPEAAPQDVPPLVFGYTNWRGETGTRRAIPLRVYHGSTEWHPEPQWLLEARDLDKDAVRAFALKDMRPTPAAPAETQQHADKACTNCRHAAIRDAVAAEREACARVAADWRDPNPDAVASCAWTAGKIAAAIRARSTTNTGDWDDV